MGKDKVIRPKLADAAREHKWERLKNLAENDDLTTAELKFVAEEFDKLEPDTDTEGAFKFVAEQSSQKKLQAVFRDLLDQGLWRSVSCVIGLTKKELQKQAVERILTVVSDGHCDYELSKILPHCADDQFDQVWNVAVERGLWSAVRKLMKRKRSRFPGTAATSRVSFQQRTHALSMAAAKGAADDDFSDIAQQCVEHEELRGICMRHAVLRGLWDIVGECLELTTQAHATPVKKGPVQRFLEYALCLEDRRQNFSRLEFSWAVKEGCKRADEDVLIKFFLPFATQCGLGMMMLKAVVKRKFWRAAAQLLGRQTLAGDVTENGETAGEQTDQTPPETDKQFVVRVSLEREMWSIVKILHKNGLSEEEQLQAVAEKAAKRTGMMDMLRHQGSISLDKLQLLFELLAMANGK